VQRPVQQVEPVVGAAIAAHLVQAQQGAGDDVDHPEHLVDQLRLLRHVDQAAHEAERDDVHHRGGDRPGAEAQHLGLEQIFHGDSPLSLRRALTRRPRAPSAPHGSWPGSR
jgi:hypothetical protein